MVVKQNQSVLVFRIIIKSTSTILALLDKYKYTGIFN